MDNPAVTVSADAESAPKIGHKTGPSACIEVITRSDRRRTWTLEQKREIVAESLGPALTPTELARKYSISSGQLYTWRQQVLGKRKPNPTCRGSGVIGDIAFADDGAGRLENGRGLIRGA